MTLLSSAKYTRYILDLLEGVPITHSFGFFGVFWKIDEAVRDENISFISIKVRLENLGWTHLLQKAYQAKERRMGRVCWQEPEGVQATCVSLDLFPIFPIR